MEYDCALYRMQQRTSRSINASSFTHRRREKIERCCFFVLSRTTNLAIRKMARLPQLPSSVLLVGFLSLLTALSLHFHYELPLPLAGYAPDSTPQFSELRAKQYVSDLAQYDDGAPRYRILGTKALVESEDYVRARKLPERASTEQSRPSRSSQPSKRSARIAPISTRLKYSVKSVFSLITSHHIH